MNNGYFVSIIIPARNEEKVIGRCLSSIHKLNAPSYSFEIIVVDHNSQDKTASIAEQYNAKVVRAPGASNVSALRNIGVRNARGDILAFLDADCIVRDDWLAKATAWFKSDQNCLVGNKYDIPEQSTYVARSWDLMLSGKGKDGETAWIPGGNMFVTRKNFDLVGGFDEKLITNEDVDLCLRLKEEGCRIVLDKGIRVIHLGTPQTYGILFRKELWHGIGAFQTFMNDIKKVRNLRPVLYAFFYSVISLASLISLIIGLIMKSAVAFYFFASLIIVLFILPLFLSLQVAKRNKTYKFILGVSSVFLTYGIARALCFIKWFFTQSKQSINL